MSQAATRFLPAPTTIVLGLLGVAFSSSAKLTITKRLIGLVFLLNWRSWPFVWHIKLWGLVPLVHLRIKLFGIDRTCSIARDPFRRVVTTRDFCSLDQADWNGHMSNTSYGKALDVARFNWLLDVVGPAMGPEGIWSPLGQTAFAFFSEIPMLTSYNIEVSIVSWDGKWITYVARFTMAPKRGSRERTLHCIALSRSCFKLRTSRLSIPPARVLSLSGLGPDRTNWERTLALRAAKKSKRWLLYGGAMVAKKNGRAVGKEGEGEDGWDVDGMEGYEERRVKGLEIVGRFGNVDGWEGLGK